MKDVKPCPFCGGEVSYRKDDDPASGFWIACEADGCFGPNRWDLDKDVAVAFWNRRALPAVQPDAREAALLEALAAVNAKWRSGAADTHDELRGLALAAAAISDLLDKPEKDTSHE